MITVIWGTLVVLGFILLIWYLDTCVEVYQNHKSSKQHKQDRENARYIQKVDRYYHEV